LIRFLQEHAHAAPFAHLREDGTRTVDRTVVDNDELFFDGKIDGEDAGDNLSNGGPLVIAGHHDRQLH
jgi:hypothetical protein